MKPVFDFYQKFARVLVTAGGVVGASFILLVTLSTFYEVVARYVFKSPTTWSLDYCIYLVMWGTFIGAAYTLREGGHIHVDVLIGKFSEKRRRQLKFLIYILALLFCGFLTWRGLISCIESYRFKEVTLSYTRTPLYIPLFSIVVGGGLLVVEIIRELIEMLPSAWSEK